MGAFPNLSCAEILCELGVLPIATYSLYHHQLGKMGGEFLGSDLGGLWRCRDEVVCSEKGDMIEGNQSGRFRRFLSIRSKYS